MFLSHSQQEKAFDFFASFIRNVLNGENKYEALVKPIISDAKSLSVGEKDYFTVNRTEFDVIVFLAQMDTEFFKGLDTEHISKEDYIHILKLVSQRELISA